MGSPRDKSKPPKKPKGKLASVIPLLAHKRQADRLFRIASELDERPETRAEAEAVYLRAIRIDPTHASAHVNLANLFFARGDHQKAKNYYEQAMDLDGDDASAPFNLGVLYQSRGDHKMAMTWFRAALRRDPSCVDAILRYARSAMRRNDFVRSRLWLGRFLRKAPPDHPSIRIVTEQLTWLRTGKMPPFM